MAIAACKHKGKAMAQQSASADIPQITVEELARAIADPARPVQAIDVREPEELEIARLDGFANLPLSQQASWAGEIHHRFDAETETLVMCHHGIRSAQMCQWLRQQGFRNVKNVIGGIDAYALAIDSSVPRY